MKNVMVWGALALVLLAVIGGLIVFGGSQPTNVDEDTDRVVTSATPNQFLPSPSLAPTTLLSPTTSPSLTVSPTAATGGVTISVNDTGFTPASVTVPVGTAVTFVNNGQGSHWPASDNHPTHTILPEFDAKRGLTTGESYSFTFTKAGTWRFHDHLNTSATGSVTVR